jgi:ligand-binding sensor domain-containing protein/two-component sensor histidine kinase
LYFNQSLAQMKFLLLTVFFIYCGSCFTQNAIEFPTFEFKQITTKEGLSNNNVNTITQDKNGLIWVGTEDGLNRLDGYRIKQYYHTSNQKNAVVNSIIREIYSQNKNTIWIGTGYGVSLFDNARNRFFEMDSLHKTNLHNETISAFFENDGKFWVFSDLHYYEIAGREIVGIYDYNITRKNAEIFYQYKSIAKDKNNQLWVEANKGIVQLTSNWGKLSNGLSFELNNESKKDDVSILDGDNLWFISSENRLVKFNLTTKVEKNFNLHSKNNYCLQLFMDVNNKKWILIGVDDGYEIFDPLTSESRNVKLNINVTNIFIDNKNGIWFGSNAGVLYSENRNQFVQQLSFSNLEAFIPKEVIKQIEIPGKITRSPNNYFLPLIQGKGLMVFNKNWEPQNYYPSLVKDNGIESYTYFGNVLERDEQFWVAMRNGLAKCDKNLNLEKSFTPDVSSAKGSKSLRFKDILPINKDEILIKSYDAIFIFNTKTEQFIRSYFSSKDGTKVLTDEFIAQVVLLNDLCYLATENGLLQLNIKSGELVTIPLQDNNKRLSCIVAYRDKLWIGSEMGLTSYNCKTKQKKLYTKKEGLCSDNILFSKLSQNGKLWLATSNGLSCFDIETETAVNFSEKDGLIEKYMKGEVFIDDSNRVIVGNTKGLSIINAKALENKEKPTPSFITELLVNNEAMDWQQSENVKSISLPNTLNNIGIYFTVANAVYNESYYYKINKTWYDANSGFIQLNSLADGKYIIQVSNRPLDRAENDAITITILPPYYKTWWFYLLCTIFICILLYAFYHIRIRNVKREALLQKSYEQKLTESQMQTLRSQMNPHFVFNTLNSINSYIIQHKTNVASEYLTTFSKLMRSILDLSKHERVPLQKEIQALKMYMELEALRLDHKFDYSINVNRDIDAESTYLPSLVIQPFVENAIWHGIHNKKGQGHIFVTVNENELAQLIIKIEDDGIGRKASAAMKREQTTHKSYGIDITINRLQLLNKNNNVIFTDLYNENNQAIGTLVTIQLNTNDHD